MRKKIAYSLLLLAFCAGAAVPKEMTLIRNGQPRFRIVVPDKLQKEDHLKRGVRTIREAVSEASGVYAPQVTESKAETLKDNIINLRLGPGEYVKSHQIDMPKPYGFTVRFVDEKNIVIAGRSINGLSLNTMDGIVWFLEKYLGVRYLMPGEIGTHVPKLKGDWKIKPENVTKVPDIFARQFSGAYGTCYGKSEKVKQNKTTDWMFRAGINISCVLKTTHYVGVLLDPEKYITTHPEFFPLINGKRVFPPKTKDRKWRWMNWEPCYTADGIAEETAKNVMELFKKNPELYNCSLSCNDSNNICQCEKCKKINAGLPKGSESQTYYEWVCKVVDIVRKQYPDHYFGILTYWVTWECPRNVKLDPHVIPVICEELKFEVDPECRARLEKVLSSWDKIASSIGWGDYDFEGDYPVPIYNAHHRAKTLKWLYYKHHLKAYITELYPGRYWKNAPETYMTMKLLWDMSLDPDKILNEWFDLAVGKEAAPYLKAYYAVWENFWTNKVPKTKWFRNRIGVPFLQRRQPGYLEALSYDDISKSLEALQKCEQLAPAGRQKERAQFILRYFAMAADAYLLPVLNARILKETDKGAEAKTVLHNAWTDGVEKWIPWQSAGHTAKLRHTKDVGHDKKGALSLDLGSSLGTGMVWYRRPLDFQMEHGKNYRVTVWCKGEGLKDDGKATLALYFRTKDGNSLGRESRGNGQVQIRDFIGMDVLGDGKWHKLTCYASVPATAWKNRVTGFNVQLEFNTTTPNGKLYFDDLRVDELSGKAPVHPEFGVKVPPVQDPRKTVWTDPETSEKLGPELIVDSDMEAEDVSAWNNKYYPKVKEKSTKFFKSGKRSLHIVSAHPGDGVDQLIRPVVQNELFLLPYKGIVKGKKYRVQLWYKNMDVNGWEELRLAGTGLKVPLKSTDTEWHKAVYHVTATNPPVTDYITIGYGSSKSDVYIDDVSVREVIE